MEKIEKGFCQCGCGSKTRIAPYTRNECEWIKGQPIRFVRGHNQHGERNPNWNGGRFKRNGRNFIKAPNHSRVDKRGYASDYSIKAEQALGKPLPNNSVIHEFPFKEQRTNIVICENNAYHILLHRRHRAYVSCGHANWRKCGYCHKYDSPENLKIYGHNAFHRSCNISYKQKIRSS